MKQIELSAGAIEYRDTGGDGPMQHLPRRRRRACVFTPLDDPATVHQRMPPGLLREGSGSTQLQ
jgi:hypothetical protein